MEQTKETTDIDESSIDELVNKSDDSRDSPEQSKSFEKEEFDGDEGYTLSKGYSKSESNKNMKSPTKKNNSKRFSDLKVIAKEFGVDENELLSTYLATHPIFSKNESSTENKDSDDGEETSNAVLAFLFHYNEETGKLEFLFDQVRPDYS